MILALDKTPLDIRHTKKPHRLFESRNRSKRKQYRLENNPSNMYSGNRFNRSKFPSEVEAAFPITKQKSYELRQLAQPTKSMITYYMISANILFSLHQDILKDEFYKLALKHPIFRTGFDLDTYEEPLQIVYKNALMPLCIADLRLLSFTQQKKALVIWFNTQKQQPFELSHAPLVRAQIHLKTNQTALLSFICHSGLLEIKQFVLLFQEFLSAYQIRYEMEIPFTIKQ